MFLTVLRSKTGSPDVSSKRSGAAFSIESGPVHRYAGHTVRNEQSWAMRQFILLLRQS